MVDVTENCDRSPLGWVGFTGEPGAGEWLPSGCLTGFELISSISNASDPKSLVTSLDLLLRSDPHQRRRSVSTSLNNIRTAPGTVILHTGIVGLTGLVPTSTVSVVRSKALPIIAPDLSTNSPRPVSPSSRSPPKEGKAIFLGIKVPLAFLLLSISEKSRRRIG